MQNSPLYFGGIPSLDIIFASCGQISSYDFVGCMRDIYFNGVVLDVSKVLVKPRILSSCPRIPENICHERGCGEGGTCVDEWFSSLCRCRDGYAGERCNRSESTSNILNDICFLSL